MSKFLRWEYQDNFEWYIPSYSALVVTTLFCCFAAFVFVAIWWEVVVLFLDGAAIHGPFYALSFLTDR